MDQVQLTFHPLLNNAIMQKKEKKSPDNQEYFIDLSFLSQPIYFASLHKQTTPEHSLSIAMFSG